MTSNHHKSPPSPLKSPQVPGTSTSQSPLFGKLANPTTTPVNGANGGDSDDDDTAANNDDRLETWIVLSFSLIIAVCVLLITNCLTLYLFYK